MKMRAPSPGFCYLVLVAAGFAAFSAYLAYKPWFHREGRELAEGRARYLVRLADRCDDEAQRFGFLARALPAAALHLPPAFTEHVLGRCLEGGFDAPRPGVAECVPGLCWAVGLTPDRWTRAADAGVLVVRNDTGDHLALESRWRVPPGASLEARGADGAWSTAGVSGGDWTEVTHRSPPIPPGGHALLAFCAGGPAYEDPVPPRRGVQLVEARATR